MKKIIILICIVVVIIATFAYVYNSKMYTLKLAIQKKEFYESYLQKEITGIEVASIINKVVDENEKNKAIKNTRGMDEKNNKNNIELEISFIDNDKTYTINEIYNSGIDKFVQYYGQIIFKCTDIIYHTNTQSISKIIFAQVN